ncbi:tol-pal system-associated acyl-CoA thioesterase [Motiliproteus sp. MSK22-1]|uniref:tol-pal system-associated acyl-CoA thioesterase n=1 Tax=Motiliproteus sp. MSK22-1 TaxID=1897630 RepID=UPI0009759929|nr:tol-pal system-associated acyl-CoA thioesterase [Motiliproteus sp. MSK22-1]OMH38775.1 tol-pal system-associated acyl-CoA thioesterase [Motiliproteus sp. MSK22-1]
MEHLFPLRVYMEDTDTGGIVYYVNYLKFMERARTELLRELGFEQASLKSCGLIFVVHSATCKYLQPSYLDDELQVETVIEALSPVAISFEQRVRRIGDRQVTCFAQVKIASVNADTIKPVRLPKPLKKALESYLKK